MLESLQDNIPSQDSEIQPTNLTTPNTETAPPLGLAVAAQALSKLKLAEETCSTTTSTLEHPVSSSQPLLPATSSKPHPSPNFKMVSDSKPHPSTTKENALPSNIPDSKSLSSGQKSHPLDPKPSSSQSPKLAPSVAAVFDAVRDKQPHPQDKVAENALKSVLGIGTTTTVEAPSAVGRVKPGGESPPQRSSLLADPIVPLRGMLSRII